MVNIHGIDGLSQHSCGGCVAGDNISFIEDKKILFNSYCVFDFEADHLLGYSCIDSESSSEGSGVLIGEHEIAVSTDQVNFHT